MEEKKTPSTEIPSKNDHLFSLPATDEIEELKQTIRFLQEELVKKTKKIEELQQENHLLMKTALKHAQERVKQEMVQRTLHENSSYEKKS